MFEASKEFLELTFREEEARGNYPARGPGPCPVAENVRSARTGRRAVKWVGLLSQSSLKLRAAWCPILAPIQIELVLSECKQALPSFFFLVFSRS